MAKIQNSKGTSEDTKTIVTVLLLLFAYPIGFILMLFWTAWPKWVKLLVSIPVVLTIFILVSAILLIGINPGARLKAVQCAKLCENSTQLDVCMRTCSKNYVTPALNK